MGVALPTLLRGFVTATGGVESWAFICNTRMEVCESPYLYPAVNCFHI